MESHRRCGVEEVISHLPFALIQSTTQPGLRDLPIPFHCSLRDLQDGRNGCGRQSAIETQLDDSGPARMGVLQILEHDLEIDHIQTMGLKRKQAFIEHDMPAAPAMFDGLFAPGVIDDDRAHRLRREREELVRGS